ncbi:MAG: amidohydrolase family protein, partial [Thermoanaerobaculia bacterium]
MKRPIGLSIALLLSMVITTQLRAESAITIVHAGRILDVRTGSLLPPSLIRIEAGLIVEVSPAAGEQIPADAVDLSSLTVLPGLIDAHTHLCDNTHLRSAWDPWTLTAPAFGIIGAANSVKTLEAGFTTVRNMSEPFYAGLAIRDAIE